MLKHIYSENIITAAPDDKLSAVLSLLSSSHDSAFVLDEDEKFLGIINPYYCVIKKSYPGNTKVKHCLFHPPKVDIRMPLERVARLMVETKIHYLPVFEQKKLVGIISARKILDAIRESEKLATAISSIIKRKKPLVSVYEDSALSRAMSLFKEHKISKLVVITRDFRLTGILAYYDLISYLAAPRERMALQSRVGDRVPLLRARVKNFMKTRVLTVSPDDTLRRAADMILDRKIGSVIVVDASRRPVSIITTRDLLDVFSKKPDVFNLELMAKSVSRGSAVLIDPFIAQVTRLLRKAPQVQKARVIVKQKKKGKKGGVFEIVFSVFQRRGAPKIVREEGRNLQKLLVDLRDRIKALGFGRKSPKR